MAGYNVWVDRLQCILAFVVPCLVYVSIVSIGAWWQGRQRKKWLRERRRLEKIVSDYNKAYKDDYNPFER